MIFCGPICGNVISAITALFSLVTDNYDAATAAYRVGYDDPSQFSREYKRQFGEPPIRDAERLKSPLRAGATSGV